MKPHIIVFVALMTCLSFQASASNGDYSLPTDFSIRKAYFEYGQYSGMQGFFSWVSDELVGMGIYGNKRVPVRFDISKKGRLHHVVIPFTVSKEKRSLIRGVLLSSPLWKPANKSGVTIQEKFTIPVYIDD